MTTQTREPYTLAGVEMETPCETCEGRGYFTDFMGVYFRGTCKHCNGGMRLTSEGRALLSFISKHSGEMR